MACDATTLLANSAANGYFALSHRDLLACILQAACAGGGGAASSGVTSGNGSPVGVVAATKFTLYVQLDSTPLAGVIWYSDGVNWH